MKKRKEVQMVRRGCENKFAMCIYLCMYIGVCVCEWLCVTDLGHDVQRKWIAYLDLLHDGTKVQNNNITGWIENHFKYKKPSIWDSLLKQNLGCF